MIVKISLSFFLFAFLFSTTTLGNPATSQADSLLFESNDVLNISIESNISELIVTRDRHMDDMDAVVSYISNKSEKRFLPAEVKVRGNYRLKTETCDFPPLKLKFKSKDIIHSIFTDNKRLKLVTHCMDANPEMQSAVYREYLAYRIYNIISAISLKVRLVECEYIDSNSKNTIKHFGFLIEDDEHLCKRLSYDHLPALNLSMEQLDRNEMIRMAMFQYMIGNKDWSVPKLHNVILLREGTHVPPISVPYDFDMSSFVNPPYRAQILGSEEEEIIYKGHRIDLDEMQSSIDHYLSKKEEIIDLILDFPYLSVNSKQLCLQQIEAFYAKLKHKSGIRRTFVNKVR